MLKSSLLEILRTFSKQELIKFEDFVRSPYFNKKENVLKLYIGIKKYYPSFESDNLEKEKIWNMLFPGKEYNYGIMKNLIFDLSKLTVKFIELENYSEKKFESEMNILEQYFSRKLLNSYEKKSEDIKNNLSEEKPSSELYYHKYILGKSDMSHLYANYTLKNIRKFNFTSLNQSLVLNFFSNYFLLNANIFFSQTYFKIDSDNDFIRNVVDLYSKTDIKNYYTDIFYYIFKCSFDQRDDANYFKLKKLCFENFEKLNKVDRHLVTDALIIYCINKTTSGDPSFIKEKFQYYKIMDDYDLLLKNKKAEIEGYMFLNTVVAACSSGEFDWAEKFIEKYKSKLPADEGDNFINLSHVHINFKKKNFEIALTYLSRCNNTYGMDKINIKTYEAFLFYELRYYEELKNLIDASRHFIRNDKMISDEVKLMHGKFIEAVNKLNEYRYRKENNTYDRSELHTIKNYVSKNEMPHKGWLNNKLSELENEQKI